MKGLSHVSVIEIKEYDFVDWCTRLSKYGSFQRSDEVALGSMPLILNINKAGGFNGFNTDCKSGWDVDG